MKDQNRSDQARKIAGLSVGQAAKLLNVDRDYLLKVEDAETIDDDILPKLCDLYRVRAAWLTGEVPRRDYEAMKSAKGYDKLEFHDRDVIAEFAAMIPRNEKTAAQRLEEARNRNKKR